MPAMLLVIVGFVVFLLGIRIVRPTHRGLVERLGRYHRFAEPGFHWVIPIIDRILRQKAAGEGKRTRAIVIYPMNALANSQQEELNKYLGNVKGPAPITFARYTGQEDADERRRISEEAPDILLTNFVMLELLMTRQDKLDRDVIGNCEGLDFLVLDELHTYRGRQGADVALLVRRVRERLSAQNLLCVGTSATMASGKSIGDKKRAKEFRDRGCDLGRKECCAPAP